LFVRSLSSRTHPLSFDGIVSRHRRCRILRAKGGTLKATISAKFSANAMIKIIWPSELFRNNAYTLMDEKRPAELIYRQQNGRCGVTVEREIGGKCKGHRRHDASRRMATSFTFARFLPEGWN